MQTWWLTALGLAAGLCTRLSFVPQWSSTAAGDQRAPAERALDVMDLSGNRTIEPSHLRPADRQGPLPDLPGKAPAIVARRSFQRIFSHVVDRGMINLNASFGHHLFQIPEAQAIGQIPPDAQ